MFSDRELVQQPPESSGKRPSHQRTNERGEENKARHGDLAEAHCESGIVAPFDMKWLLKNYFPRLFNRTKLISYYAHGFSRHSKITCVTLNVALKNRPIGVTEYRLLCSRIDPVEVCYMRRLSTPPSVENPCTNISLISS